MEWRRFLMEVLIGLFLAYLVGGACIFFFQSHLVYHPDNSDFDSCEGFEGYRYVEHDGTRMKLKKQSEDVVVYYHGNAGSVCDRSAYAPLFEVTGKSTLFVEYTGYSGDDVHPSRDTVLADVTNTVRFLEEEGFEDVIVYGQSIGTGAASYHASIGEVHRVILVNPFTRTLELARARMPIYPASLLFRERYDNVEWLEGFFGGVFILQGDEDRVIPPQMSKRLYEAIPHENKSYTLIEGRGHNDIWQSKRFRRALSGYIDSPS